MNEFSEELNFLLPLVKEVGVEVMKVYGSDFSTDFKEDESPVTQADLISNDILIGKLKANFPHEIVSEEVEGEVVDKNVKIWVIDPLDGTSDFVQKTDEFSIMIALLDKGIPVIGVVYVPALKKLYFAEKGKGAYVQVGEAEPERLEVSKVSDLKDFSVVRSRNHFGEDDQAIANNLNVSSFKKMGSVGVKFGAIAEGKAELCYYTTDRMGIWDDCASHVILKEAGGEVFTIDGSEPIYDLDSKKMKKGFIGTNGTNKAEILKAIQRVKKNIRVEETHIDKDARRNRNKHHSAVLWFTGFSGSGKSTLAKEVERKLFERGVNVYVLDGDNLRFGLNGDLSFSAQDREENIRRVAEVSKLFVDSGHFVMSAFISPYKKDRDLARSLVSEDEFVEVFVDCPIEVCESRDVKGLYQKAREGKIKGFTGIDDPYEVPEKAEIVIDTSNMNVEESVEVILDYLQEKGYLKK